MTEPDNGSVIRFTVKELLGQINHKLDVLDGKLDGKAEAATVNDLTDRVRRLEDEAVGRKAVRAQWVALIVVGAGTLANAIGVWTVLN